jgi:DNA excision repair protein ERCC-2
LNVVGFSATLKPFAYYSQLCGFNVEATKTLEFSTPFPKENRKLLVIPQVSTKYSDREKNYAKIGEAIARIVHMKLGNYFVFFPSFSFLDSVRARLSCPEFNIIQQTPEMKAHEVQGYIRVLQEQANPTLILAVQGGVFSEGVDYPGNMLIGAIIVGPALPNYNLEREMLRQYYEKTYGDGFDYAYTYPAMAKVVQSAGRVIRSETDRGLIVLMDRRFTQDTYAKVMPSDWFDSSVNELISNSILSDIQNFWQQPG